MLLTGVMRLCFGAFGAAALVLVGVTDAAAQSPCQRQVRECGYRFAPGLAGSTVPANSPLSFVLRCPERYGSPPPFPRVELEDGTAAPGEWTRSPLTGEDPEYRFSGPLPANRLLTVRLDTAVRCQEASDSPVSPAAAGGCLLPVCTPRTFPLPESLLVEPAPGTGGVAGVAGFAGAAGFAGTAGFAGMAAPGGTSGSSGGPGAAGTAESTLYAFRFRTAVPDLTPPAARGVLLVTRVPDGTHVALLPDPALDTVTTVVFQTRLVGAAWGDVGTLDLAACLAVGQQRPASLILPVTVGEVRALLVSESGVEKAGPAYSVPSTESAAAPVAQLACSTAAQKEPSWGADLPEFKSTVVVDELSCCRLPLGDDTPAGRGGAGGAGGVEARFFGDDDDYEEGICGCALNDGNGGGMLIPFLALGLARRVSRRRAQTS